MALVLPVCSGVSGSGVVYSLEIKEKIIWRTMKKVEYKYKLENPDNSKCPWRCEGPEWPGSEVVYWLVMKVKPEW